MTSCSQAIAFPICPLTSKRIKRSSAPLVKVVSNSEESVLTSQLCETLSSGAITLSKRVVLVRHGQSTWNEEGRIQGSSDFSVLTRKGETQAETSRQMLSDDSFDVCFSSPLLRSKKTADIIWGSREDEILTDADLREIDLFSFQGLLKDEGKAKFGESYRQWQVDPANFIIDAHYPVRELWDRARTCWRKILTHNSKSVLVVAHNAVNQALVATAIGLGTNFFRVLLQSNCGVSVLDFTPGSELSPPLISLNRLNQTPSSPVLSVSAAGRKASKRIILACHGTLRTDLEVNGNKTMNMLGIIQSQKTAELLLDVKVRVIVHSPEVGCSETAMAISRVQEAADCLGADCVPRYVEMKELKNIGGICYEGEETENAVWDASDITWKCLIGELTEEESLDGRTIVVVASPVVLRSLVGRCLGLMKGQLRSFHVDTGSISVLDFPDGALGRGIVRCLNYTAHLGRWSIPITKPTPNDEDF